MLDAVGGLSGGLGGGGGMGQSPGDSAASSASSTATIMPTTTLGTVGGGYNSYGPFSVNFPGAQAQPSDAINSPTGFTHIFGAGSSQMLMMGGVALIFVLLIFLKKH